MIQDYISFVKLTMKDQLIYQSEYDKNIDRKSLRESRYESSCTMVLPPVFVPSYTSAFHGDCVQLTFIVKLRKWKYLVLVQYLIQFK